MRFRVSSSEGRASLVKEKSDRSEESFAASKYGDGVGFSKGSDGGGFYRACYAPTELVSLRLERDGVHDGVRIRVPACARGIDSALAHRGGSRRFRAPPQRSQVFKHLAQLAEVRDAGLAKLVLEDAASRAGAHGCGGVYYVARTVAFTLLVTCRSRAGTRARVTTSVGYCEKHRTSALR